MFDLETSADTTNVTSSPESASGAMHCDSQDGPTIGPYGPDRALASLSAKQAAELVRQTEGICGLYGATSSSSVRLQQFLVSRLRARLQCIGSPLFKMTWKADVTPSRRLIYRLRAQALRTSDNACSSWPTAAARDWKSSASNKHGHNSRPLNEVARLASWSTPAAREAGGTPERFLERKAALKGACGVSLTSLSLQAQLASGAMPNGSTAATKNGVQLNPAHSRWLMGLPPVWDVCGVTAMQSLRRSRRNSSRRS